MGRLPDSRNMSAAHPSYRVIEYRRLLPHGGRSFGRTAASNTLAAGRAGACGGNHATAGRGADIIDCTAGLYDRIARIREDLGAIRRIAVTDLVFRGLKLDFEALANQVTRNALGIGPNGGNIGRRA